jgi:hypothetical protein
MPCSYLVSQPSVAESPSLSGFASLPEVEDPRQHPTFAPLFDPEWAAALRERLRLYLHIVVAAPQVVDVIRHTYVISLLHEEPSARWSNESTACRMAGLSGCIPSSASPCSRGRGNDSAAQDIGRFSVLSSVLLWSAFGPAATQQACTPCTHSIDCMRVSLMSSGCRCD